MDKPMTVYGPLDTPAMQHNQMLEAEALEALADPFAGPSMAYDAECILKACGWPPLAIEYVRATAGRGPFPRTLSMKLVP